MRPPIFNIQSSIFNPSSSLLSRSKTEPARDNFGSDDSGDRRSPQGSPPGCLSRALGKEPADPTDGVVRDPSPPPDPGNHFPRYADLKERFVGSLVHGDSELIEERFLELYSHLHMHEAPYTADERRQVDSTGGYWCHAGGLSPILKAGDWLNPGSVSADLGAGNGLQGLLFQKLYPHAKTTQVEISSRMVEIGRVLQAWLKIPADRVEWVVADVIDAPVPEIDFLYLYRPVRPDGPGRAFYQRLASCARSLIAGRRHLFHRRLPPPFSLR